MCIGHVFRKDIGVRQSTTKKYNLGKFHSLRFASFYILPAMMLDFVTPYKFNQ